MEILEAGAGKLGWRLSPRQMEQFGIYYRELVGWNRRVNLTSITGYEEVQVKHFLDSLTVAAVLPPAGRSGWRVIDVGSGAGLPGLPLKILFPEIKLVLLEATAKKTEFLRYLADKLGLDGVEVVAGRAEEAAHEDGYREQFKLVLSRAVAPLSVLAELTLPFAGVGGSVIAQKKGNISGEVRLAGRAVNLLGGSLREVKPVELAELPDKHSLVVIDKVQPTPDKYPRRPGVPAKRPLV